MTDLTKLSAAALADLLAAGEVSSADTTREAFTFIVEPCTS